MQSKFHWKTGIEGSAWQISGRIILLHVDDYHRITGFILRLQLITTKNAIANSRA
jgi:hypothetical protein